MSPHAIRRSSQTETAKPISSRGVVQWQPNWPPSRGTFSGNIKYEPVEGFFKRPGKWGFVEVADVDVDADNKMYVCNRSPHPVMVFDKDGNFVHTWGEIGNNALSFQYPHGISVGPDGNVYTADTDNHTVKKWTRDGKLLMTIGHANLHSPEQSGLPFNRPTHFTIASNGDYYVSDGYGNSHVHCFDSTGKLKFC